MLDMRHEVCTLIADRNLTLLNALYLCIEQLERLPNTDAAIRDALQSARDAAAFERQLQAERFVI